MAYEEASEAPVVDVPAHECVHVCALCGDVLGEERALRRVKEFIDRQRVLGHLRGPVSVFADELLLGLGLE